MGKKNNKSKKRKNKPQKEKAEKFNTKNLRPIPVILKGDFQEENNNIEDIQQKIDLLPKSNYKRRILFISEASHLHTGFATYVREVLKRLYLANKYEIAEFGCYGHSSKLDPNARQPWKYYHNMPSSQVETIEYGNPQGSEQEQNKYRQNQFGKWKLPYVLADFKPDIVLLNRDHWMDEHICKEAFRNNFICCWMPTVDGYPQKWDWLRDYASMDKLFAYSWFGKKVLEEQSACIVAKKYNIKKIEVSDVIQPGVDLKVYRPLNKLDIKKTFGIGPEMRFIGTVMRNQPRKLFTRIIESFRLLKEKYPDRSQNLFLLLHTSIPDVGWDIPECIIRNGLVDHVVFSYICRACKNIAISNFRGSPTDCPVCKSKGTFCTPNTQCGFNDEQFNCVYNLMDLYIQGSIAEGDGMPVNEAKACGVPVLASDFSALAEKARNGGAMPIKNSTIYTEHETMQWRSLFSREDLCEKMAQLLFNRTNLERFGKEARECAEKFYSWELCAKKWEFHIDSIKIKDRNDTWDAPIDIKEPTKSSPSAELGDQEFIEWLYKNILMRDGVDSEGMRYWSTMLQQHQDKRDAREKMEEHFRGIIEEENKSKRLRENPKLGITNPVDRIAQQIKELESVT